MDVMPNWLKKRVELSPDRIALISDNDEWTFSRLAEEVKRKAGQLTALDVKKGDHVALLISNSLEGVATIHALASIGAVAVFLNTRLTDKELSWQLDDASAKLLICDNRFLERRDGIQRTCKNLVIKTFAELSLLQPLHHELLDEFHIDETNCIIYTSGTTGNPKGVMLSYANHWWSAVGSCLNLGLHEQDRWVCCLPIFHVGGLSILYRSLFYGMTVILQEKFDPQNMNDAILNQKATMVSVVSAMLSRMLDELGDKQYPSTLRCVLLGGGPAPKPLLESCRDLAIPVYQTYGMTETASQIVTLSAEYMLSKLGSAGKPLFQAQLKIVKDGKQAEANQAGEIIVKGPNVTMGYYNRSEETEKAFSNGWLHTGDIGYLDEEGFLYVLDRRSDLIISGGENIYPAEVESVLLSHPAIEEAGVVGREDQTWGEVPVGFIKAKQSLSEKELISYCQERLAKYKVPKQIFFVRELPRNASNKLLRRKLKELL